MSAEGHCAHIVRKPGAVIGHDAKEIRLVGRATMWTPPPLTADIQVMKAMREMSVVARPAVYHHDAVIPVNARDVRVLI